MDKAGLMNQLVIMKALLMLVTEKEIVDDLMNQIEFTEARVRALVE